MAATATTTTTKKTILITGANGGLGSAIIEQITSKPEYAANHGLYTVRDPTNAPRSDYFAASLNFAAEMCGIIRKGYELETNREQEALESLDI
ncbi:hypothetical protein F4824DRAFT_503144 [Ustulina deusta]|nr:hypothetical protein F4824DRAFT_503144 [Ustulina deusta]